MITSKWFVYPERAPIDAHIIRRKVFIEEQRIPESVELDGTDERAVHLVIYDDGRPIATGRLIEFDDGLYVSRIAVLPEFRGYGYGALVVNMLIQRAAVVGAPCLCVYSQIQVAGFYQKLGFVPVGEPFFRAGIEHVRMVRSQ